MADADRYHSIGLHSDQPLRGRSFGRTPNLRARACEPMTISPCDRATGWRERQSSVVVVVVVLITFPSESVTTVVRVAVFGGGGAGRSAHLRKSQMAAATSRLNTTSAVPMVLPSRMCNEQASTAWPSGAGSSLGIAGCLATGGLLHG